MSQPKQYTLLEAIDNDIATLQAIREALAAIPEVHTCPFHPCGKSVCDPRLIQIHSNRDRDYTRDGLLLAKALGGQWARRSDGAYEGTYFEHPALRNIMFVLHSVEQKKVPVSLTEELKRLE